MSLIPSLGRHVVKNESVTHTSAELILVEFDKEDAKYIRGVIVEASEGYITMDGKFIASSFKKGDIVWYYRYNSATISQGRESFVVVGENDIIAKEP